MRPHQINGLIIIIVGIAMFIFGTSMFSYQGKNLDPDISKLGEVAFFLWLPTIIAGVVVIVKRPSQR